MVNLASLLLLHLAAALHFAPLNLVNTTSGLVAGRTYDDGLQSFVGIRFANAKRLTAPTPVRPWRGIWRRRRLRASMLKS